MTKLFIQLCFLSVLISSCTLSARQEASLNQSVSKYVHARNECQLVGLIGFTYPALVKEIKEEGDSVFLQKFDCEKNQKFSTYLSNPTLRSVEQKHGSIHVLYEFDTFDKETVLPSKQKFKLIAISENDGLSWFFMAFNDYKDKKICKSLIRIIDLSK